MSAFRHTRSFRNGDPVYFKTSHKTRCCVPCVRVYVYVLTYLYFVCARDQGSSHWMAFV